MALAENGRIKLSIEKFTPDDIDDVYQRLRDSAISGRAASYPA
jgi:D-arabinose 1-dehydrogenase-like Zn-dependent alcohol dehydrogenase